MGVHWKSKQALRTQLGKACLTHQCGNLSPCIQAITEEVPVVNLFAADWDDATHEKIFKIEVSSSIIVVATCTITTSDYIPYGVLCGDAEYLYTADSGNKVYKIRQSDMVLVGTCTVTGGSGGAESILVDDTYIYVTYMSPSPRIVRINKSTMGEVDSLVLSANPTTLDSCYEMVLDNQDPSILWAGGGAPPVADGWKRVPRVYKIDLSTFTEAAFLNIPCPEPAYHYGPIGAMGQDDTYLYIAPYYNAYLRATKSPLAYDTRLWLGFPDYPQFSRRWIPVFGGDFYTVFNSDADALHKIDCATMTQEDKLDFTPYIGNGLTKKGDYLYAITEETRVLKINPDTLAIEETSDVLGTNYFAAVWS